MAGVQRCAAFHRAHINAAAFAPKRHSLRGHFHPVHRVPHCQRVRAAASGAAAEDGSLMGAESSGSAAPAVFTNLERLITDTMGSAGPSGDWREVEGSWVLYPPASAGAPRCLIHFTGGAFVAAAPQVAYAPLLQALAARGAIIVATPFATSFDHLRTADEIYFKFSRCIKALGPQAQMLPAYGLGHSLGALMQLFICSRYVVPRAGNILMSFNNRPATDSIPFLSPFIAPSARALGPLLSQLATSPLRTGVEQWVDILKGISPGVVRQVIPVLEQLTPIYLEVAQGTQEFTPAPEESRTIVRGGYAVGRNLLLRFAGDTIDETPALASVLQSSAAGPALELTVKTLPGDHVRPLKQDLNRISPDLVRVASQGLSQSESFWAGVGSLAEQANLSRPAKQQLSDLAKLAGGVTSMIGEAVASTGAAEDIEGLADEVAGWMGLVTGGAGAGGGRQLPPGALPPAS